MNKNFIRHILLLSTLFSIFIVNVHFLYAAKTGSDIEQDYADTADIFKPRCTASSCIFTFIAPIPIVGMNLSENNKTIDITGGKGVADYVAAVYKTLIAGIAAVALVYMVYGAAMYASTDALFKKAEGKTAFKNALAGLGLALVSYTILATLNPFLLSTNFNPANISVDANPTQDGTTGTGGGAVTPVPDSDTDTGLSQNGSGYEITPTKVAIDTDGTERPPFNDPDWKNQTSYPGLNANTDPYVVVPIGSKIELGTKVTIRNNTNGRSVEAIVGDRGPSFGEMSLAAAKAIGVWREGLGNEVVPGQSVTYTFQTGTD